MFKISPNQAPTPTGFLRGASLGTLLESATEGRSKMQSSPSCWPGKGLEKMIFFLPYFLNTHGRPSRSPWGWTPVEGGRMFPPAPGVVPELTPRPCPEVGLGRNSRLPLAAQTPGSVSDQPVLGSTVPLEFSGTPRPWEQRKGNVPLGESGFAAPSVRAPTRHRPQPAGRDSNTARPPSEAITAGRNSDLVQGNSVFPRCRVVRAWVI